MKSMSYASARLAACPCRSAGICLCARRYTAPHTCVQTVAASRTPATHATQHPRLTPTSDITLKCQLPSPPPPPVGRSTADRAQPHQLSPYRLASSHVILRLSKCRSSAVTAGRWPRREAMYCKGQHHSTARTPLSD